MFLRAPCTREVGVAAEGAGCAGLFAAARRRKNPFCLDFLLSALCSDFTDTARADAAVRTVRRRSSGSTLSSSSSSVSGLAVRLCCLKKDIEEWFADIGCYMR